MNEIAREWVEKAENDYDAAELILRGSLQSLEQFAVLIRYPGLIVPAKMAERAFESSNQIRKYVRKKLGINNPEQGEENIDH